MPRLPHNSPLPLLSINQLTTFRWAFDDDVYFAKRAGFSAIGVWRRKVTDFGEARTLELLAESHMKVSCLGWAGGFTGGDGRSLDESIRDGLGAIGLASRLGAECLIVVAGPRNNHIGRHRDRLLRLALDDLLMAAEVAGVTLAIKPMHLSCAAEWTFHNTLEEVLDLVTEYSTPHLQMVYDIYHFPDLARSPELLSALVPHLALVQLGDARLPQSIDQQRCPLGAGVLPLWETVAALRKAGYNKPVDVELMGPEIELADYEQLLVDTYQTLVRGIRRPAHLNKSGSDMLVGRSDY